MSRMEDLFGELCRHEQPRGLCAICKAPSWGKLKTPTYQDPIADLFPWKVEKATTAPNAPRRCVNCAHRGAKKGHRINIRLPRDRVSFNIGAPVYPPSWWGPIIQRPKPVWATHCYKGRWLCDRCDPDRAVGEEIKAPAIVSSWDQV